MLFDIHRDAIANITDFNLYILNYDFEKNVKKYILGPISNYSGHFNWTGSGANIINYRLFLSLYIVNLNWEVIKKYELQKNPQIYTIFNKSLQFDNNGTWWLTNYDVHYRGPVELVCSGVEELLKFYGAISSDFFRTTLSSPLNQALLPFIHPDIHLSICQI
jgi:hypothetical protein